MTGTPVSNQEGTGAFSRAFKKEGSSLIEAVLFADLREGRGALWLRCDRLRKLEGGDPEGRLNALLLVCLRGLLRLMRGDAVGDIASTVRREDGDTEWDLDIMGTDRIELI